MSALAKIKKTAAQHEQDRQYDKALAQYARLLDGEAGSDEDVDVTLYNRAGDLALRAGDVPRAVTYFERAIDLYAAGGFLNNAVALAVKILRHAPGHLAAHHTLGVLYARKGFRAESRQHLAEYAAQMHRAGREEEVRRTLAELAALGSTVDEVAAARELLTTRAAGPDDAGALVKLFDAALGPAAAPSAEPRVGAATLASTHLPLSELLEREVRGEGAPAASEAPRRTLRWLTGLPGDPAPLRISALRARPLAPVEPAFTSAPSDAEFDTLEMLDLSGYEPVADDATAVTVDLSPVADFMIAPVGLPEIDEPAFGSFAALRGDTEVECVDLPAIDEVAAATSTAREFAPAVLLLEVFEAAADEPAPTGAAAPTPNAISARAGLDRVGAEDDASTDLGEWLRSTEPPSSTRLVTAAPRETGDEAADFDAALRAFTAGIAQAVDAGDRESHYDLGVAFREMGLLPDAVREFQCAVAAPGGGLREREALAQCFLDLGRAELALATLEQATTEAVIAGRSADTLVGVHYVLAESARVLGRTDDARGWYVRVLATDYTFGNAAAHLAALPPPRTAAAA